MLACDNIFDNFGMTTLQAQKDIKVANQIALECKLDF